LLRHLFCALPYFTSGWKACGSDLYSGKGYSGEGSKRRRGLRWEQNQVAQLAPAAVVARPGRCHERMQCACTRGSSAGDGAGSKELALRAPANAQPPSSAASSGTARTGVVSEHSGLRRGRRCERREEMVPRRCGCPQMLSRRPRRRPGARPRWECGNEPMWRAAPGTALGAKVDDLGNQGRRITFHASPLPLRLLTLVKCFVSLCDHLFQAEHCLGIKLHDPEAEGNLVMRVILVSFLNLFA